MKISRRQREEARPFYDEGGEAIGRLLSYHPEEEPRIWVLVAGTGIWKRWYLRAFASIWRLENPAEYARLKVARYDRKRERQKRASKLDRNREAAKAAMLPKSPDLEEGK